MCLYVTTIKLFSPNKDPAENWEYIKNGKDYTETYKFVTNFFHDYFELIITLGNKNRFFSTV